MSKVRPERMKEVASILMCPICGGQIRVEDYFEYRLLCTRCGERYPIVDGIPIMVSDQARLADRELIDLYSNLPQRTGVGEHYPFVVEHLATIKKWADLENKVVVDFGGGEGLLSPYLEGVGRVIVTDISLPRLRQGANLGLAYTIYLCGDLQTQFINCQCDVVLLMSVLEHVVSPHDVLLNVVKLLTPGGVLIVFVPVCNLPLRRIMIWIFRKIKGIDIVEASTQHLRVYSTKTLSREIQRVGLQIEALRHTSVFSEFRLLQRLSVLSGRSEAFDRLMASGVYLFARKIDVEI